MNKETVVFTRERHIRQLQEAGLPREPYRGLNVPPIMNEELELARIRKELEIIRQDKERSIIKP